MKTRAILALTALAAAAGTAVAQPALRVEFSNGTNAISVAPGTAVPVSIYATGLPAIGTAIPWTTNGGTGQPGQYAGWNSVLMNMNGTTTGTASWSGMTIAPGFAGPPFGNAGTASGTNVTGINIGVAFQPPVTTADFLLWSGTVTVGNENVNINPAIQPTGAPPQGPYTGFEVSLSGVIPNLLVTHFIQTSNGLGGTITVPAPASLALLGLGGLVAARRRRA